MRTNERLINSLREIKFDTNVSKFSDGACSIHIGDTHVICTANIEENIPRFLKNTGKGWISAEYSMLPGSTHSRIQREISKGKINGRTQEIQRLIGRSLRAAVNLSSLKERQVLIDCDVMQADGGTRTASITAAYIALYIALRKLFNQKRINVFPIKNQIAAISCGIVNGEAMLDLDYAEDSSAEVDSNFVIDKNGKIIEIQATAENKCFDFEEFQKMHELAQIGVKTLISKQNEILQNFE
ncbi:MAG: ribonuclease PH [Candidatus Midichloriaceae bacterium]|jgi:ribonuclease PH